MDSMGWIQGSWHGVTDVESSTWLVWAAWATIALGIVALVFTNHQISRNRRLAAEQTRPHVGMLMEPHAADWHVIELVVRNFGRTAAYDIRFSFPTPPTVAEYENSSDGYAEVVELQLPRELPVLAPGQEWRMVWDSALDRAEIGGGIESRFAGSVIYYDRADKPRGWRFWERERQPLQTSVVLDWEALPPVQRIELMTTHDLAKREKQKLELLRGLLTYFHYASKETRADVFRSEIERINNAVAETQDRWRARQVDAPTDVGLRLGNGKSDLGKHRDEHV
ncbi:hypothetical protein [Mycobacterium montefiorense]|uniref:Uncharacterized protein n=1 Tax=Mycobacterium montefiorense TaxID=154654 RepID=A0AA37PP97_9MYCO|nr:hypothetical protein [Mycobacterium montefiorense]GBG40708.1 hypothetical protein MmonteBS_50800 [Mycobacterium montefiorense]GKU33311.1 hypothetical protein NJB14191_06580 [Mycobacterium montefiorense]GKU44891.1 hypothetical protein NJB14194_15150 [Mycobacterium montefiorense]GKU52185.1 hypothetical protein NJB14195_34290 [Mycobacterium montefiorense]GKU63351.1 hypothetical protein NJB18182_38510 [Mycobacterium montefiorense]